MKKQLTIVLIATFFLTSAGTASAASVSNTAVDASQKSSISADAEAVRVRAGLKFRTETEANASRQKELETCAVLSSTESQRECRAKIQTKFDAALRVMRGQFSPTDVRVVDESFVQKRMDNGSDADMRARMEVRKRWAERIGDEARRETEHNFMRFDAMYNRLVTIAGRINSRIDKVEENGGDTSVAVKYMSAARVDLSEAKSVIDDIKEYWQETMNRDSDENEDRISVFGKLRTMAVEAKAELRSAHANMIEAVKNLPKPNPSAETRIDAETRVEVQR